MSCFTVDTSCRYRASFCACLKRWHLLTFSRFWASTLMRQLPIALISNIFLFSGAFSSCTMTIASVFFVVHFSVLVVLIILVIFIILMFCDFISCLICSSLSSDDEWYDNFFCCSSLVAVLKSSSEFGCILMFIFVPYHDGGILWDFVLVLPLAFALVPLEVRVLSVVSCVFVLSTLLSSFSSTLPFCFLLPCCLPHFFLFIFLWCRLFFL